VTRAGVAKRLDAGSLASVRSGNTVMSLGDGDRVVAAFDAPDGSEVALVSTTGHALRFGADALTVRGPGAAGVTGMKLRPGATVLAAAAVSYGALVVLITDEGAVKVTEISDVPSRGRGTAGSPTVKLAGFETQIVYGWVGLNRQLAAVVAPQDGIGSPDPVPQRPELEPTRRNGPAKRTAQRILALGEYRF